MAGLLPANLAAKYLLHGQHLVSFVTGSVGKKDFVLLSTGGAEMDEPLPKKAA